MVTFYFISSLFRHYITTNNLKDNHLEYTCLEHIAHEVDENNPHIQHISTISVSCLKTYRFCFPNGLFGCAIEALYNSIAALWSSKEPL